MKSNPTSNKPIQLNPNPNPIFNTYPNPNKPNQMTNSRSLIGIKRNIQQYPKKYSTFCQKLTNQFQTCRSGKLKQASGKLPFNDNISNLKTN